MSAEMTLEQLIRNELLSPIGGDWPVVADTYAEGWQESNAALSSLLDILVAEFRDMTDPGRRTLAKAMIIDMALSFGIRVDDYPLTPWSVR